MIRTIIFATAIFVAVLPAAAQHRAPVSQGATSSSLASQIEQVRIQNADMRIQMGQMVEDVQRLTGRVETLEFLLSQSRDEFNDMQADNQDLARQLSSLRGQISQQKQKITALESRAPAPATTRSVTTEGSSSGAAQGSSPSQSSGSAATQPARPAISTTTRSGPHQLTTGATTSRTASVTTPYGAAGRTETGSTQAGTSQRSISEGTQPVQTGSLGTLPASQLPGDAGALFADAKSKLLKFQYAEAETAFRAFLDKFGSDPQAGEAQYWIGEVLYQQKAYAESGKAYTQMIRTYPNDPRAPDALVKLARSMRLVGDTEKACQALSALPRQYPNASGVTKDLAAVERTRSGCDS